jgi:hypothetical protein
MLKKYTNPLLQQIREEGLDHLEFVSSREEKDGFPVFVVRVRDTPLYFTARSMRTEADDLFDCTYSTYRRGHPAPTYSQGSKQVYTFLPFARFGDLQSWFGQWLREQASRYLVDAQEEAEDALLPDLWAEAASASEATGLVQASIENTPFTEEERSRIEASLKEFARQVQEQNLLASDQISLLNDQVGYLVDASHRLSRKDWLVFVLGSLVTLAAGAGFSPDVANMVIKLGGESLRWIAGSSLLLH